MEKCATHGEYDPRVKDDRGVTRWLPQCPKCMREHAMKAVMGRASIPPRFALQTFSTFSADSSEQSIVAHIATDYATNFASALSTGKSLIFCGRVGTGKTHLACGILHSIISAGFSGVYATAYAAVRRVKDSWTKRDATETEVLQTFVRPDLLVLDEVGVQFASETERILLFEIINGRYENLRPTLLVSNLDITGVETCIGPRALDRLREGGGRVVIFDWDSHRKASG